MAERPPDDIDELYSAPPERFVGARDELAKRLRGEGDRQRAQEVKKLRKPSVPAWGINAAARGDRAAARRLVEAGEGLARAQAEAGDAGGGERLRAAIAAEQEAVEEMVDAVREVLRSAEQDRPALVDRVRNTLRAVAGDRELRREFETGRVVADREPVGFGAAGIGSVGPSRRRRTPKKDDTEAGESEAAKRERRAEARRVRSAERELEKAAKSSKRARDRAERAERALAEAREELASAEAARAQAEAELEQARRALDG